MNITIRIESFRLSQYKGTTLIPYAYSYTNFIIMIRERCVNIVFHPVTPEANENGRQCTRHDNQRLLAASRQTKSYQNERDFETVQPTILKAAWDVTHLISARFDPTSNLVGNNILIRLCMLR
ncbi:hypothetical protein MTR_1g044740 [Medicago truncatula]|uniref:Uncharacterized protein n=1 Tax=Medicago truncatula TaxID=3880 RepID=G7I634_MEDTR|nr:hypothetical protein MTR_1g044740 [Medicago truncatula]